MAISQKNKKARRGSSIGEFTNLTITKATSEMDNVSASTSVTARLKREVIAIIKFDGRHVVMRHRSVVQAGLG